MSSMFIWQIYVLGSRKTDLQNHDHPFNLCSSNCKQHHYFAERLIIGRYTIINQVSHIGNIAKNKDGSIPLTSGIAAGLLHVPAGFSAVITKFSILSTNVHAK